MESGARELTSYDLRVVSTDKQDALGVIGQTTDGRLFRYAQISSSAVTAGYCVCSPSPYNVASANSPTTTLAVVAAVTASPNALQLTVTLNSTAATQDQFMDGYLNVVNGTGAGTSYKIKGNTVGKANGSVIIFLVEPLYQSIDTTSKVVITVNPWSALTISTGNGSGTDNARVAGVPTVNMAANTYGWIQTNGYCTIVSDQQGIIYNGLNVVLSNSGTPVAGTVQLANGSADADKQNIGIAYANIGTTGTKYFPAYLTIG